MEAMVKVGDTVSDVQEGLNAGMWTIALTKSGNELGLPLEAIQSLPPSVLTARLTAIENRLREAGAHYVAEDISQVSELLPAINERLSQGERP
jgi:phosphonoacetaldehyde hydrolase